jgi:beta-galactosidase
MAPVVNLKHGIIHRHMPDAWSDIFKKMRAMGLNCVETYCAWNMHEKKIGEFDFSGNLDIRRFVEMARDEGLMVIVRPGPYICA